MHFLGLDAGGSGGTWLLVDADGAERRRGSAPAMQLSRDAPRAVASAIRGVLAEAGRGGVTVARTVCALAGAGDPERRQSVLACLDHPADVVVCTDIHAAGARLTGSGVLVQSGTGSFVVALGADQRLVRGGGRGPLLGDQGSAFGMVLAACRQVVAGLESQTPPDPLARLLCASFGVEDRSLLPGSLARRSPAEIAAFAPALCELATQDGEAARVLSEEFDRLAQLTRAVAERAALVESQTFVSLAGGVFSGHPVAVELFTASLDRCGAWAGAVPAPHSAAWGAARLARFGADPERPECRWLREELRA